MSSFCEYLDPALATENQPEHEPVPEIPEVEDSVTVVELTIPMTANGEEMMAIVQDVPETISAGEPEVPKSRPIPKVRAKPKPKPFKRSNVMDIGALIDSPGR